MLKKLSSLFFSRSSVSLDILITGGSNIAIVLLTFLSYGLVARIYPSADLSEYMINRRLAMTILPFIVLCMPMALCRYLPLTKDNRTKKLNYTIITTGFILLGSAVFSAVLLLNHTWFSKLFFNKIISITDMFGLIMLCIGGVLIEHLSAYFRGMLWIKISNLLVIICTGIMPLLIVLIFRKAPIYNLIFLTGIAWTAVSLVFVIVVITNLLRSNLRDDESDKFNDSFINDMREIASYSITRIPGILSMSLIWIISPILIVHFEKMDKSAYILAGLQFLSLATIPLRPISYVFFPLFSEYKSQNKQKEISILSSLVSSMAFVIGMYFTLHLLVLSPVILDLWLNIRGLEAIITVSVLMLSMAPYMCFEINRNIIDTYFDRPYITYITASALLVMLSIPYVLIKCHLPAIYSVAIGTVLAFMVLGYSTEFILHRKIIRKDLVDGLKRNYNLNIIYVFLTAGLLKLAHLLINQFSIYIVVAILVVLELIIFYFFIKLNILNKTTWIEHIVEKLKLKALF